MKATRKRAVFIKPKPPLRRCTECGEIVQSSCPLHGPTDAHPYAPIPIHIRHGTVVAVSNLHPGTIIEVRDFDKPEFQTFTQQLRRVPIHGYGSGAFTRTQYYRLKRGPTSHPTVKEIL